LLFGSNPMNTVVATGVATYFPLRTVEKRNPRILFAPLTSVVAGDKAGLIVRVDSVRAVAATDVAFHLPLRTAEKRDS